VALFFIRFLIAFFLIAFVIYYLRYRCLWIEEVFHNVGFLFIIIFRLDLLLQHLVVKNIAIAIGEHWDEYDDEQQFQNLGEFEAIKLTVSAECCQA